MKKVLFLTKHKFPYGDASSKRNMVLSNYFVDRNYSVVCLGMGSTPYKKEQEIEGVRIVSLRKYKNPNLFQKVLNHIFITKRIISYAEKHYHDTDIVVADPHFYKFLCKKKYFRNSQIIYSAVEFYSPSEYKFNGYFSKNYKDNINFNVSVKPSDGKIIAISTYLENHFKNKGIDCLRIPFVVDSSKTDSLLNSKNNGEMISFIYCGNPRSKDNLLDILLAFTKLPADCLAKTNINIYGVDNSWLRNSKVDLTAKQSILSFTTFHGYQKYDSILGSYLKSDFSLLLRPSNERYSKAGFPTKISESLEYGVPPITNFTSDLNLYLKDMKNCIEVKGDSIDSFRDALLKVYHLTPDELYNLKREAKKASIEKLDVRCFYSPLDKFIG